ncbi:UDP-N-acetylglucosamine--N-acetylmuramyl-(pentapeptide) pyrophosphoryl-undecaprenol N-acetylglucosamine transferase [Bienertia sinuspersici]
MYSLLWRKLCSAADDRNRVRPNMHTSQPTLPRSNRQYVSPLMLARGRGKKLSDLHTSKTKVSAKSNIGTESYLGVKSTSLAKRSHSHLYKKGHSSVLRNENRASFNPLYDVGARYEDFGSPEESLREGPNSIENPNGLNIEDVNENVLDNAYDSDCENVDENVDENANGNPLEELGTNQQDVFSNENMESYREHVLDHMKELWINWRSDLLRYNVKNKNITLQSAYNQKPPNRLDKNDWRWLIKEVYSTDKFKCKGANKGIKPDLVNVFYTTRKKDNSLPNAETTQKYDEIREILGKDLSLPHVEVAQRVFKSKSRDRVVGFGGGIKLKDIKGPQPSREELEVELNTTKKQNQVLESRVEALQGKNDDLKGRVGSIEAQMKRFDDMMMNQLNVNPSSSGMLSLAYFII